jgi:hypothetical protein
LVVSPLKGSSRFAPLRITPGEQTAYGISTLEGVTARHPVFIWRLELALREVEFLDLLQLIYTSQDRLAARDTTGVITLSDETFNTSLLDAGKPGRSTIAGSQVSLEGKTAVYCNFSAVFDSLEDAWARRLAAVPNDRLQSYQRVVLSLKEI